LTKLRVQKCRANGEAGLGWIGFWFDKEALAILLNETVPRPERRYKADDAKGLAEGCRELLMRLAS
jgi:hypothetical protein